MANLGDAVEEFKTLPTAGKIAIVAGALAVGGIALYAWGKRPKSTAMQSSQNSTSYTPLQGTQNPATPTITASGTDYSQLFAQLISGQQTIAAQQNADVTLIGGLQKTITDLNTKISSSGNLNVGSHQPKTYITTQGDTWSHLVQDINANYGTNLTAAQLSLANPQRKLQGNRLAAGQTLTIPGVS
jgi:LysM domain